MPTCDGSIPEQSAQCQLESLDSEGYASSRRDLTAQEQTS